MFTVRGHGEDEIVVKKSKFIANIYHVDSQKEAIDIINKIKKQYWDAKHNVYAYIIEGSSIFSKYTDDGEPQGTAGLPIFQLMEKKKIKNTLIVITRYFGGTLLGTGGLVKAYTEVAKKALLSAEIIEIQDMVKVEIEVDYEMKDKVHLFLEKNLYEKRESYYGENVKIIVNVPKSKYDEFCGNITDAVEGKIIIKKAVDKR